MRTMPSSVDLSTEPEFYVPDLDDYNDNEVYDDVRNCNYNAADPCLDLPVSIIDEWRKKQQMVLHSQYEGFIYEFHDVHTS